MGLSLGNTNISEIYLGSTKISEVYLGSSKIYSNAVPPTPPPLPSTVEEDASIKDVLMNQSA